jgi:hypothetical protein
MKNHCTLALITTALLGLANGFAQAITFTKITTGPVATNAAAGWSAAWGGF